MTRLHEGVRTWLLGRAQFLQAVRLLSALVKDKWEIDLVIGIARGGLEPAKLIALDLNRPLLVVRAKSNVSDEVMSETRREILVQEEDLLQIPQDKRILLVDDICGSGMTLRELLRRLCGVTAKVHCVTLCCNEGSALKPDAWIWTVRDWVIFPWEDWDGFADGLRVTLLPEATMAALARS